MVGATDLKVFKSLNNLGGAITGVQINSANPNNLFTNVPKSASDSGEDYYACVFFKNTHATEAMDNFKLWLDNKSFPHDTEIKWGFDPIANETIFFDGVDDYVDCTNDSALWSQSLTKFSFAFWIYPLAGWDTFTRVVVNHGTAAQRFRCYIRSATTGGITFSIANAANVTLEATSTGLTLNQWNHVVCVYDNSLGSANLKIYVNATVGATTANLTEAINVSVALTLSDSTTDFKGYMKDFIFWKSALSQSNVTDVYLGNEDVIPDPDYRLKMTEGVGKPLDSESGTKSGTLAGAVWNSNAQIIADKFTAPNNVIWQVLGGTPQTIPSTPSLVYHYQPYQTFNGTSDFINVPDTASLDLLQFSISAWFRTDKVYFVEPIGGGEGIMVMKGGFGTNTPTQQLNYGFWVTDANHIRGGFEQTDGTDHFCNSNSPEIFVNDGLWHHAVLTYDQITVRLYLDGNQIDTHATTATPETNALPLRLGRNPLDSRTAFYQGDLDEVYVWNNDLTASEVSALYLEGTVPQSGAIVYSNTFGTSTPFQGARNVGTLAASTSFPIWVWYHVSAGAQARLDDSELFAFRFDIPQGGTAPPPPPPIGGGGTGGNPPPVNVNYKVALCGDWGCETATDNVIKRVNDGGYNILVGVGDNAYASPSCWTSKFKPLKDAGKFQDSAYGNHEYSDSSSTLGTIKSFFGDNLTYHTFKYQNILFLIIDDNDFEDGRAPSLAVGSTQHNFIKSALEASQSDNTITWRIAIIHHPWFGADSKHGYNEGNQANRLHNLFITNKVSFVVTGHNHNWQRTKQVTYNSGDPKNPNSLATSSPYSRNVAGLIHVISGTGGHDSGSGLYGQGSQPSFNAYQNRTHNGIWEIVASNNGQTLTCSFVDLSGDKFDTFVINA